MVQIRIDGHVKEYFFYDTNGRKLNKQESRWGFFRFRKNGPIENESLSIIEEETDPIFLENQSVQNSIKYAIFVTMNQCQTHNDYPDNTCFATG